MTRILDGRMPAIFENGCGLYFPDGPLFEEYEWHPVLRDPAVLELHSEVKTALTEVSQKTGARRVIGKEVLLSYHPKPPMSVQTLRGLIDDALSSKRLVASVTHSASSVDVSPQGIDKGAGLRWLIDRLNQPEHFDLARTAGIGDSDTDASFLRICGLAAVPANADEHTKNLARYQSPMEAAAGVVDIIRHCIAINVEA
jgi:hydroxymethylpyrimidine pyrophosphatase-like HAD family hydrolase